MIYYRPHCNVHNPIYCKSFQELAGQAFKVPKTRSPDDVLDVLDASSATSSFDGRNGVTRAFPLPGTFIFLSLFSLPGTFLSPLPVPIPTSKYVPIPTSGPHFHPEFLFSVPILLHTQFLFAHPSSYTHSNRYVLSTHPRNLVINSCDYSLLN